MEHHFNIDEAVQYGVNAAIILNNLKHWVVAHIANETNIHTIEIDDQEITRHWVYYSTKGLNGIYPYMGDKQIRNALKTLIDKKAIIKGNFSNGIYNRTTWYALFDEKSFVERAKQFCRKGETITNINYTDNVSKDTYNGSPAEKPVNDSKELKLHPIIDYYNTLPKVVKHKSANTKRYKKARIFLKALEKGNFKKLILKNRDIKLDKQWFKDRKIPIQLLDKKFSQKELKNIVSNLNNYLDENYYPNNQGEKPLPLMDLLFNPRTGRSIAMWVHTNPPKKGEQIVNSKFVDVEETYKEYAFDDRLDEQEERELTIAVNGFAQYIEDLYKKFDEYNFDPRLPADIYRVHAKWIKVNDHFGNGFSIGAVISTRNKFWKSFEKYLAKEYGTDLNPGDEHLEIVRDRKAKAKAERTNKKNRKAQYESNMAAMGA